MVYHQGVHSQCGATATARLRTRLRVLPGFNAANHNASQRLHLQDLHPWPADLRVDQDRQLYPHRPRGHLRRVLRPQHRPLRAGPDPLPSPRRSARGRRRGDARRRPPRTAAAAVLLRRLCDPRRRGPEHPSGPDLPWAPERGHPGGGRDADAPDVPAGLHLLQQPGPARKHLLQLLRPRVAPAGLVRAPSERGDQRGALRRTDSPASAP
mmetsp:Transcript_1493/g.4455  ORF Transcript_1493/g.4455 Transcript_1493/m.4455 type:complete len:210 (-) Transcript_1493:1336-1965(-)